ncbi:MAG: protein phosphatase 2C domain-containing protein [Intrasporangium sp.]|uniref:protein phosphatase 2C domain-containing protein n=1 Tax=Intrasporangium sp. TaxID=1925024 RepID=UPI002649758D|nr:protein phosphatase 2C domain-containing protein [Intrasporangium sp.]MDN5795918.1 protein phosphatase 2C domain-containing protein [Intrasporangium sp.]
MTHPAQALPSCRSCGAPHDAGASFCEACGADLTGNAAAARTLDPLASAATPQTAPPGDESPLDTGWTGAVPGGVVEQPDDLCRACGQGRIVDGYCDHCGTPPPDPRNHFTEAPSTWVAGVCDIGRRHTRNEDAMALCADEPMGARAVLVVCDGVSMATDSHIASLAAAQEARDQLSQPLARGVGTPEARAAATARALTTAVLRANEAVKATVTEPVPNPPSCTFAAAVVEAGTLVAGTVGDSRVYWLPDDATEPARQLGEDDSFAAERIRAGVPREQAENGPQAHSITRWLGPDAPEDLTPHLTTIAPHAPGWLLVCSDGLWNYCSEPGDLRDLVATTTAAVGDEPERLAQALVDFANDKGGRDNITVALARLAGQGSRAATGATATQEGEPTHG